MIAYSLIDTTLREGEQFLSAEFTLKQKIEIARALDQFGVEYLELTSPAASRGSEAHCRQIRRLGLRAKVLAHIRCHLGDAQKAVAAQVDGVNIAIGTSAYMQRFNHGMDIDRIIVRAREVISFLQDQGVEVRFSAEDSFRSHPADLLRVYRSVAALGVDRVGIADTLGTAEPRGVFALVHAVREAVSCDIEFHAHNDSGCAIANAYCALEAGATHISTSVLGIGERNGIASLGGLIARLYTVDRGLVAKYDLRQLMRLETMVGEMVGLQVPFNSPITGSTAFTHKAGIHTHALLRNPATYEAIAPSDFGLERKLHIAHRLTGWTAVHHRARQLGLNLTERQARSAAACIKGLADRHPLSMKDVDDILREIAGRQSQDPSECHSEAL
jgi:homocitrate synthase